MSHARGDLIASRYLLVETVGHGGQGRVWRAHDRLLGRDVAIKELVSPSWETDDERTETRERTLREARAIARLDHPNVVKVFDVVSHDGEPWIVMELVTSRSLSEVIADDGAQSPEWTAAVGLSVLSALRVAHRAGILHRDVKPANVLIADDGRVLLTDFGMAAMSGDGGITRTGLILGSPAYLAPERALGENIGEPSDLWSLGATLFAAVEGKVMFDRSTSVATLAAVATAKPPQPKRAGPLRPALEGLLRRDPAERVTADQAEALLRRAVNGNTHQLPVRREHTFAADPASGRRPRATVLLGTAAAALAVALGTILLVNGRPGTSAASVIDTPAPVATPSAEIPSSPARTRSARPKPSKTARATVAAVKPGRFDQIIGQASNLCVEAPGQVPRADGGLQIGDCRSGAPGQRWTFAADGTLRTGGMCMDTRLGATGNGAAVVMAACVPGRGSQRFGTDGRYLLHVASGRCVDAKDQGTVAGTALQIWDCGGTDNQVWRLNPVTA
jgi:eukaryotic-like serine/threonine-protein kinase